VLNEAGKNCNLDNAAKGTAHAEGNLEKG